MTKNLADDRKVDARCQAQRRGTVTQVVQSLDRQPGRAGDALHVARDVLRVQHPAILTGEHEPYERDLATGRIGQRWRALPGIPPDRPVGVLSQSMREQSARRGAVEVDGAVFAAGRLRTPELHLVAELDDLTAHDEDAAPEVDVVPAQPERLATAQTGHGHQLVQRPEPVARGRVEERAELRGLPWLHLRPRGVRQLDVNGRVVRDPPLLHRVVQGRPQRRVDPPECRRTDRPLTIGVAGHDRVEHPIDVCGTQPVEWDRAKVRHKV